MSVTVDDVAIEARSLGLTTVGEVLSHVARKNRLVVQLLIDGTEPDLSEMESVRSRPLDGCSLFIETAQPLVIAREVLTAVDENMTSAEELREQAAEAFRLGNAAGALQKLSGCFATWHNAQDSLAKVARLLRTDLTHLKTEDGRTVADIMSTFAGHLRQLRDALEGRDFVLCCDVLTYDMAEVREDFRLATQALHRVASA